MTSSALSVTSDQPAAHRQAIMFCCDQNYVVYAAHAAVQIADLHPDRDFDICFCFGERPVSLPESLSGYGFRTCHVETAGLFDGLRLDEGKSHDVYLRLALPSAFAGEYDRILYLDGDIFVQGGDFSRLLTLDIAPSAIAAVRDNMQWRTPNRRPRQFKVLGLPTSKYFNAGVLLMDVPRYNALDLLGRCVALGRANADKMIRHDQNLYNAVLHGDWSELSPTWNWQYSWSSRLFAEMRTPNLIHFIGKAKPWRDPLGELAPRYGQSMRRFATRHFPDFTFADEPSTPLDPVARKSLKMFLKHLLAARATSRYLARFADDTTVAR